MLFRAVLGAWTYLQKSPIKGAGIWISEGDAMGRSYFFERHRQLYLRLHVQNAHKVLNFTQSSVDLSSPSH